MASNKVFHERVMQLMDQDVLRRALRRHRVDLRGVNKALQAAIRDGKLNRVAGEEIFDAVLAAVLPGKD